jgi:hypothetical protein
MSAVTTIVPEVATTAAKVSPSRQAPPATLAIFGAAGDLSKRLVVPALYEAPNHLPQCRCPTEIFTKLFEHVAVECGAADCDSLFLDPRRGHSFGFGGGLQRSAFGEHRCKSTAS